MEQELDFQNILFDFFMQNPIIIEREICGVLYYLNSQQQICEIKSSYFSNSKRLAYKNTAYRLLKSGKPACVLDSKVSEFASKKSLNKSAGFSLEHLDVVYIGFVFAGEDLKLNCMYFRQELMKLFYSDICTKLKQASLEKKKAESYAESFAHLSHEFKSPINVMQTSTQLLKLKLKKFDNESFKNIFEPIITLTENNILKLARLTLNILDLSRVNNGALELVLSCDNFAQYIKSSVEQMREFANIHNINIEFRSKCSRLDKHLFDKFKMDRILQNLLSNSIVSINSSQNRNGKILVKVDESEDFLRLTVEDNGTGICEREKGKLFDSFYTQDKTQGIGLGLAVVKAMAELHEGNVCAENLKHGGARFVVKISKNINTCKAEEIYSRTGEYFITSKSEYALQEQASLRSRLQK